MLGTAQVFPWKIARVALKKYATCFVIFFTSCSHLLIFFWSALIVLKVPHLDAAAIGYYEVPLDTHCLWAAAPSTYNQIFLFAQTACCRGSGGVGKKGLERCRETSALPVRTFYCKNRYMVIWWHLPSKRRAKFNKKNFCGNRSFL